MAARVITVTSGKGGVGKTTATANLGVALASLGQKVACLDADIGLRNLDVVMGLENRIVYDIVDVVEGRAKLRQAMIKDKRLQDELYLIPAAQTRDKTAVSPSDMVRVCDELRTLVDFVLIDSPAGIERGFRNAIAPADEVIIVTNPEVSSVRDADRIIGLIEAEGKGPGKLIINRVKPDMVKRGDMLSPEDIIDILAIKLIGLVPEDETILISTNRGLPVALSLDQSQAGRAFHNIARRLLGEEVPFLSLDEQKGLLQRVFKRFGLGSTPEAGPAPARRAPKPAVLPAAEPTSSPKSEPVALPAAETRDKEGPRPVVPASGSPESTAGLARPEPIADKPAPVSAGVARSESPAAEPAEPKPVGEPPTSAAPTGKGDAATPPSGSSAGPPAPKGEAAPKEAAKAPAETPSPAGTDSKPASGPPAAGVAAPVKEDEKEQAGPPGKIINPAGEQPTPDA